MLKENKHYRVVCFGEILWDILPDAKMPGGAPMNVAYHLNQLQTPAALISCVGVDVLSEELLRFIESKGLCSDFIQRDAEHPTGKVLASLHGNEVNYEILQPVAWDFIRASQALQELVAGSEYFIFGSLAARNQVSRETLFQLLEMASFKIFDNNLREPHYKQKVLEYLLQHADILQIHTATLDLLSEWFQFRGSDRERILSLQERFQLHTVVTTRGERGAIALNDGDFYEHHGFRVKVADAIGAGDAFLAAFLSKFMRPLPMDEAIEYASAMGAFVATRQGACPSYVKEEIDQFLLAAKRSGYA